MEQHLVIPATDIEYSVSILAGNSRVSLDSHKNEIIVQPQIAAFRAALIRAKKISQATQKLPSISIAFDHRGVFRKQFLIDGLTHSQQRKPRLSQLRPEIRVAFESVATELDIPLNAISVIHEDSARTHASHIIQNGHVPKTLIRFIRAQQDSEEETCTIDNSRVTYAAITSEYFASSIAKDTQILEVFFEDDAWSKVDVYMRGAVLMEELGSPVEIQLRLVNKAGRVLGKSDENHRFTRQQK